MPTRGTPGRPGLAAGTDLEVGAASGRPARARPARAGDHLQVTVTDQLVTESFDPEKNMIAPSESVRAEAGPRQGLFQPCLVVDMPLAGKLTIEGNALPLPERSSNSWLTQFFALQLCLSVVDLILRASWTKRQGWLSCCEARLRR